ncbi:hypothetical protein V8C34DRAFT_287600 [Trichoderma compactum]
MHTKHKKRLDDDLSGSCLFSRIIAPSCCQALASKPFLSLLSLLLSLSSTLLRLRCEALGMQPVQRFAPRRSHQISGHLGTYARSSGIWYGLPLRPETRWMSVIRLTGQ